MTVCPTVGENYHKNNEIVEYGILSEIAKNGYGSVNFVEYQRKLENIYQDYIHAKITFYRSIGQILDEQEIVNLMEFIGED